MRYHRCCRSSPSGLFSVFSESVLLGKMKVTAAIDFSHRQETWSAYLTFARLAKTKTGDVIIDLKEIIITKADGLDGPWTMAFEFMPTKKGIFCAVVTPTVVRPAADSYRSSWFSGSLLQFMFFNQRLMILSECLKINRLTAIGI